MIWSKLALTAAGIAAKYAKDKYLDPHLRISNDPPGYFLSWTVLQGALDRMLDGEPAPWTDLTQSDDSITLSFTIADSSLPVRIVLKSLLFEGNQATLFFDTPDHPKFENPGPFALLIQMMLLVLGVIPGDQFVSLLPENISWNGQHGSVFFDIPPEKIPEWLPEEHRDHAEFSIAHQSDGLVINPLFTIEPTIFFRALTSGVRHYGLQIKWPFGRSKEVVEAFDFVDIEEDPNDPFASDPFK